MRKSAYYISGPMTGWPDHNRDWFTLTRMTIRFFDRSRGWVINPFELPFEKYLRIVHGISSRLGWYFFMLRDLTVLVYAALTHNLLVYLHPKWRMSRGARLEVRVAKLLGVKTYVWR